MAQRADGQTTARQNLRPRRRWRPPACSVARRPPRAAARGRRWCRARTWRSRGGGPARRSAAAGCRRRRHRRLHRQLGQQRDADAGGHHLAQRLEAGGPEAARARGARRAGTPPAPGRAGSGPPRAAARARRRAPTGRPGPPASASGWSIGTASTKSSANSSSPCSWSSWTGRASDADVEPAVAQPLGAATSVFSSTSSSSRFGKRACSVGHHVGQQVRRERREQARGGSCPTRGPGAGRAMSRMSSASASIDPGPLDDLARRPSVSMTWRGSALDQLDAELLLQLLDLGRQRRLADEARLGGPAEVAVVGHGDQVLEIAQVHRRPPARRADSAAPTATPGDGRARDSAGADVRIRWSKALERGGRAGAHGDDDLLVRHGRAVAGGEHAGHRGLARGRRSRSRRAATARRRRSSHSVLGSRPICTKTPSRSTSCAVAGGAVLVDAGR